MIKKLIVFDLDGTLAASKAAIDKEMSELLNKLLSIKKVALISGGDWTQFQKQVIGHLSKDSNFSHLFVLPTCLTINTGKPEPLVIHIGLLEPLSG